MLTRELLPDAWREISASDVLRLALLMLLFFLINTVPVVLTVPPTRSAMGPYFNAFLAMQLKGFTVMLAVLVANQASDARRSALWPYAVAVLVGVPCGAALLWLITQWLFHIPTAITLRTGAAYESFLLFTYRHSNGAMGLFSLVTAVYVTRRRATNRLTTLRETQQRRMQLEHRALLTQLAAMRARVQPQLVVDALHRVDELYTKEPTGGDGLLRALVRYLRMVVSRVPSPESTLGAEIELLQSWLEIQGPNAANLFQCAARVGATRGAIVPSMLLLPLIEHAWAQRLANPAPAGPFEFDAIVADDRLRIWLLDPVGSFDPRRAASEGIGLLRGRLATIFGHQASLGLSLQPSGSVATVEIPCQRVISS